MVVAAADGGMGQSSLWFCRRSGLVLGYVCAELSQTVFGAGARRAALQRLRRASGWLLCTALVTLLNPWGWGIDRAPHAATALQCAAAAMDQRVGRRSPELGHSQELSLAVRQTGGTIYLLLGIAVVAAAVALLRGHWVPAILLAGRHVPSGARCPHGSDICLRGGGGDGRTRVCPAGAGQPRRADSSRHACAGCSLEPPWQPSRRSPSCAASTW